MLLGCTPDAASDTDSAVNGSTLEDSCLRDMALGCELLCHVACGADVPALKRCVEDMTFQVEIMKGIQNSSMPQVYFYTFPIVLTALLSLSTEKFLFYVLLPPGLLRKGLSSSVPPPPGPPGPGPWPPSLPSPVPRCPTPLPPHPPTTRDSGLFLKS